MNPAQLDHTAAVLADVLRFQRPADVIVSAYLRRHPKLGRQDRHETAETVFAALRHYQKISAALPDPAADARRAALCALVLGRGFNIGALHDIASKDDAAFLGSLKARKTEFSGCLNTAAELPQWLIGRLRRSTDDEGILAFGRSTACAAPLDLRVNTLKGRRDKILQELRQDFPDAQATPYSPWGIRLNGKPALNRHPLFLDGTLEVQDEGSQILAALTGARRGGTFVDFCAGAGGKTLAVGAMTANTGSIYALDVSEKRLAKLKPRIRRAGLTNVRPELIGSEHDPRLNRLALKADCVLADAPCSGLGTLRRNPDLKYRQSPETLDALTAQQASILAAAARLVRPGGRLVYATCSILPEENAGQVARFLAEHPDFEPAGRSESTGSLKNLPEDAFDAGGFLQLDTARHGTDGFFAAVLRRKA